MAARCYTCRAGGGLVWVSRIAGALLIAVGLLMLTDMMSVMSQWLQPLTPEFLRSRL